MYAFQSEGANFWLGVINDLKQRGVEDILIACIDSLKGFDEAIRTIYLLTEVQTCVVHQIRNSLKYVANTMPLQGWAVEASQLKIIFEERMKMDL